jgi:hypothetical protein
MPDRALNTRGVGPVVEDMTIARRPTALAAAVAIILLTAAACADSAPTATGEPLVSATPARPTGAVDPTAAANAGTFAAWRRSPIQPTPEFAAAVEAACRADESVGDKPLVVLDVRGEGRAILVFVEEKAATVCTARDDQAGTVTIETHEIPGMAKAEPPVDDGDLGVHELYVDDGGGSSYSVLVGQYQPKGVKDVAANFDADAAWYTAASDNGWYAIWWPGEAKPLAVATSNNRSEVVDSYAP